MHTCLYPQLFLHWFLPMYGKITTMILGGKIMKPLVIYVKENGKIELSREELDKMLEDAYQGGYSDGMKINTVTYPYYPYYVNTEKTVPNWWYEVTCTSPNMKTNSVSTSTCQCGCHSEEE